ncbi:MAG: hypothetical protein RR643_05035 [Anaerorhabdus sp.]|uniref:hypothetical protein n=1 Tax=Anaerorhabdus sp. TaxID=1872524 RepID=UPI002FC908B0
MAGTRSLAKEELVEPGKELIVFSNNGQTYVFQNVTGFKPTTTGFSFSYTGVATGITRKATFNNTSTSGYALV